MAAKPKDGRVAVVTGAPLFYDGVMFGVGTLVYMKPEDADDYVALRHARVAEPADLKRAR